MRRNGRSQEIITRIRRDGEEEVVVKRRSSWSQGKPRHFGLSRSSRLFPRRAAAESGLAPTRQSQSHRILIFIYQSFLNFSFSPTNPYNSSCLRARHTHPLKMATPASSLASKLPPRLLNFFARYPPQIYSAAVTPKPEAQSTSTSTPTPTPTTPLPETPSAIDPTTGESTLPSPYTPNRDARGHQRPDPTAFSPSKALLASNPEHPNPFLPRKNFRTGKWIGPRVGLRVQAELVKLAAKYDVEALLPPGRKSTEYKETRRAERGLAIKGTGIGQKVKGHKWERTMETRLDDRRKAMMEMPEVIRLWKQVRSSIPPFRFCLLDDANIALERSRSWLEEVAQAVRVCVLFGL